MPDHYCFVPVNWFSVQIQAKQFSASLIDVNVHIFFILVSLEDIKKWRKGEKSHAEVKRSSQKGVTHHFCVFLMLLIILFWVFVYLWFLLAD